MSAGSRPTVFLSNWGSHQTPGQHGPGRKLSVTTAARTWSLGDGCVINLIPDEHDEELEAEGKITHRELLIRYMVQLAGHLRHDNLIPGQLDVACSLAWYNRDRGCYRLPKGSRFVEDGDTLLCRDPRPDSPKRERASYIEVAAPYLVRAGWDAVIYGRRLTWHQPQKHCPACGATLCTFRRSWATCTRCSTSWPVRRPSLIWADTGKPHKGGVPA